MSKYCKAGKVECGNFYNGECKIADGEHRIVAFYDVCPWPTRQEHTKKVELKSIAYDNTWEDGYNAGFSDAIGRSLSILDQFGWRHRPSKHEISVALKNLE